MAVCLQFDNVSKAYPIYQKPSGRLKELVSPTRKSYHRDYWGLRNVSFSVEPGETLCVIGENGSGKSTLLQLAAKILEPTSGTINVEGRTAALLELGSGFNPEFDGRDNVYMNAAILGLSRREIDARYDRIIEFAGIGDFISQPVKTYSSGMAVRLGFSVAIHSEPQLLLVDEALAVGDIAFRKKCLDRVEELRQRGVTILFVSHSLYDIQQFGTKAMWLDHGTVREIGHVDMVVSHYLEHISQKDSRYTRNYREAGSEEEGSELELPGAAGNNERGDSSQPLATTIPNIDHRKGNGHAAIIGIRMLDAMGNATGSMNTGEPYTLRVTIEARDALAGIKTQILMRNHLGIPFTTLSTERDAPALSLAAGELLTIDFQLTLPDFYSAHFSLSPAVLAQGENSDAEICDWIDNAISFEIVSGKLPIYGFLHLPCRVSTSSVAYVTSTK